MGESWITAAHVSCLQEMKVELREPGSLAKVKSMLKALSVSACKICSNMRASWINASQLICAPGFGFTKSKPTYPAPSRVTSFKPFLTRSSSWAHNQCKHTKPYAQNPYPLL